MVRPEHVAVARALCSAAIRRAGGSVGGDVLPHRLLARRGHEQLSDVPGCCDLEPDQDFGEKRKLLGSEGAVAIPEVQPARTEVVGATLQQRRARNAAMCALEECANQGHVLFQYLVLQRDGVGSDDCAIVVLQGIERRGQQVGECLAGARSRLDQEVVARVQSVHHALGHLGLPAAELVQGAEHVVEATARSVVSGEIGLFRFRPRICAGRQAGNGTLYRRDR